MGSHSKVLSTMRNAPQNVRYADLHKVCVEYFGEARQQGTSHAVFRTPWPGDPRVNIQKGKVYQVKQVLAAIEKKERGSK